MHIIIIDYIVQSDVAREEGCSTTALGGHRRLEVSSDSIRCCSRSTTPAIPSAAEMTPGSTALGHAAG